MGGGTAGLVTAGSPVSRAGGPHVSAPSAPVPSSALAELWLTCGSRVGHVWVSCCQVGQAAALRPQAFASARGGWGRPLNCLDSWPFLWTPSPGPGAEAWGWPHLRMLPGSLGRRPAPCDSEAQMRWRGERGTVC